MKITLCLLSFAAAITTASGEAPVPPELREIAQKYLKGELVNPRPYAAPTLCRVPPTQALYSQAKTGSEHGGKLFYLFAGKRVPLAQKEKIEAQPPGQYLVKETWASVAYDPEQARRKGKHASGHFLSTSVLHEGKRRMIGKPLDLYIMLKKEADTPDTDQGWIYAVISRDGKQLRKAGRIRSCIDCHEDAKHDRILGDYAPARPPIFPIR